MTSLTLERPKALNIKQVKADFPILHHPVNGKRCCFLDSAASSQKPIQVMDAMDQAMQLYYANVHRGAYHFSQESTNRYERTRTTIRKFVNAPDDKNIVIGANTTSLINLIAYSFPRAFMKAGDEIIISQLEHHANFVPWMMLAEQYGFKVKIAPLDADGQVDMEAFYGLLNKRTKLVAMAHVSNVLGTILPVEQIIKAAHEHGAKVLLDGSQAAPHLDLDVQALDVDFYVFTGHKLYGPTGIGVLYGKYDLLDALPPLLGGGDMIRHVSNDRVTFAPPPARFEAGTPPIIQAIGLEAAINYVNQLGLSTIAAHEQKLADAATQMLSSLPGLTIHGTAKHKAPVISFTIDGLHAHDVATILDMQGIAVRVGHHCAEPLHDYLGVEGTIRASFACYNQIEDVHQLHEGLLKAKSMLS